MTTRLKNAVRLVPAAAPTEAIDHFGRKRRFETDCWDVHSTQDLDERGFVLLDVRSRELFDQGHLPGAHHLPHWEIDPKRLEAFAPDALYVVYCAGPHCNGALKAALRLAELGRPVKEMIGGVTGWKDEGFLLVTDP